MGYEITDLFKSFLHEKIGLSEKAIKLGIKQSKNENAPLAIVLWSFGLINLRQYEDIIEWQNQSIDQK